MITIYKYELELKDRTVHSIPEAAHILSVAMQGGKICTWAMVDTEKPKRNIAFIICGTGNPMPDDIPFPLYVGTVHDGPFVWHIFHSPLA